MLKRRLVQCSSIRFPFYSELMDSQRIRQRRRRVALEQTNSAPAEQPKVQASQNDPDKEIQGPVSRSYTPGARRSRQFKTTDLIPKRMWSLAAVVALLLSAIAGLNLLHLNSPDWAGFIGEEGVAALSLDSGKGIGVWYSNFLLLMSACVSLQLYLLQQHRRDDYRGSYKVWMWLAVVFLFASAASVTGISAMARNLLSNVLGSNTASQNLLLLFGLKIGGLLLLVVRGMFEVRYSRLAVLGLLMVLMAYGTAAFVNDVPGIQARSSDFIHSALGNCLLVGATSVFCDRDLFRSIRLSSSQWTDQIFC